MAPLPYYVAQPEGSDQADEWLRLGAEAQMAGRLGEAQGKYLHALRLNPRHALAMQNLAILFAQSNLLNEAMLTIERAEMCDGKHAAIQMNKALIAFDADRIDDCLASARKAVKLDSKDPRSLAALTMALTTSGHADESIDIYNKLLDLDPKDPLAATNVCFVQTLTDCGPAELLAQRKRWSGTVAHVKPEPHKNDKRADRPIRVGYVGGDFKSHSASFIFGGVLLHHTPAIEMYLYSSLSVDPEKDISTKKYQDICADRWRDISKTNDEDADRMIRNDRIDILVDLAAHTMGGRLALFARKPAPIQGTAWGFAHGTGLPEVDFFFADPIAVPQEERQHYAEKVVDLPCIVTLEPPVHYNLKATSDLPYWKNGQRITFGTYARYEKMSDECLRTFAEILRRVPDSKLELKDAAYRRPYSIRRIMGLMPDISPERLLFSTASDHPTHMLTMQSCDISLDPFPHGGGVVSLETLYMGVPIVTRYGKQAGGRTASSVLSCMGRTGWIAKSEKEYIEIAAQMASDPKPLADVRKTLRGELLSSSVVVGYVEAVEKRYRELWSAWCSGK